MTTLKFIAAVAFIASLLSCRNIVADNRPNEINRIVFATGGCYGTCPIQVIDLNSSLTTKYHGVRYSDSTGFYRGNIS
jgi:hypothetical protein